MDSGYVLTRDGQDALALIEDSQWNETGEGIRFAASLEDGSGFIAYDGDLDFSSYGTVYTPKAFFWPYHAAPKRGIGTGNENYALVSVELSSYLCTQESVTGLVQVTDELLLVESDGIVAAGAVWTQAVDEFRDARLLVAA